MHRNDACGRLVADAKVEFDRWSRGYDRDPLQLLLFGPSHRMLLRNLLPTDRCVLDVGCGTGRFAARVLHQAPQAEVYGLDLSEGMLAQARAKLGDGGGRLHLVQGDSEQLPFPPDTFDVVTCSHSFHHYPHQDSVVAEMHRVLRPGGRLMIIDGDRDRFWGRFIFDFIVVLMEGAVKHLPGGAFRRLYEEIGFDGVCQERRGGLLPFLMTMGQAVKPGYVRQAM